MFDESTPVEEIEKYERDFFTIYAGRGKTPYADFRVSKRELKSFLRNLQKGSIRGILKKYYDNQGFEDDFVFHTTSMLKTYTTLKKLLTSPLKPWILLYGREGTGKISIVKSILKGKVLMFHELETRHVGFQQELRSSEIDDVLIKLNLIQDEIQLREILTFLYHNGYQAIFILDGEYQQIPESLKNIPRFRMPNFMERSFKERLLILESILRRLESPAEISPQFVEILLTYPWPGNITQLENAIRYSLSLNPDLLDVQTLPENILQYFDENYNARIIEDTIDNMLNRLDLSRFKFELLEKVPGYVEYRLLERIVNSVNRDYEKLFDVLGIKSEKQAEKLQKMIEKYSKG